MRTIVINPYERSVKAIDEGSHVMPEASVEFKRAADHALWAWAKNQIFAQGPHKGVGRDFLELVRFGEGIIGLLDEEGILCDFHEQAFFRFRGSDSDLAGICVLVGEAPEEAAEDGDKARDFDNVPSWLTARGVEAAIEWVDPDAATIAPTTITELDANMQPVKVEHPHGTAPYTATNPHPGAGR
jgi:hypothetical protein